MPATMTQFHGNSTAMTRPNISMGRIITAACLLVVALAATGCSTGPAEDESASSPSTQGEVAGDQADGQPGDGQPGERQPDDQAGDDRRGTGEADFDDPAEVLPPTGDFSTARVVLEGDQATVPLAVHVAADPDTRRQGLMGRAHLPEQAGMLFLFPDDSTGGFWMKDTEIPLSIAFFDADGRALRVLDMDPCEADPCPTYDPGVAYRSALEVNQGALDDFGLDGTDWTIRLPEDLPEPR